MKAELARLEGRMPEGDRRALRLLYGSLFDLFALVEPDLLLGEPPILATQRAFDILPRILSATEGLAGAPDTTFICDRRMWPTISPASSATSDSST